MPSVNPTVSVEPHAVALCDDSRRRPSCRTRLGDKRASRRHWRRCWRDLRPRAHAADADLGERSEVGCIGWWSWWWDCTSRHHGGSDGGIAAMIGDHDAATATARAALQRVPRGQLVSARQHDGRPLAYPTTHGARLIVRHQWRQRPEARQAARWPAPA